MIKTKHNKLSMESYRVQLILSAHSEKEKLDDRMKSFKNFDQLSAFRFDCKYCGCSVSFPPIFHLSYPFDAVVYVKKRMERKHKSMVAAHHRRDNNGPISTRRPRHTTKKVVA